MQSNDSEKTPKLLKNFLVKSCYRQLQGQGLSEIPKELNDAKDYLKSLYFYMQTTIRQIEKKLEDSDPIYNERDSQIEIKFIFDKIEYFLNSPEKKDWWEEKIENIKKQYSNEIATLSENQVLNEWHKVYKRLEITKSTLKELYDTANAFFEEFYDITIIEMS